MQRLSPSYPLPPVTIMHTTTQRFPRHETNPTSAPADATQNRKSCKNPIRSKEKPLALSCQRLFVRLSGKWVIPHPLSQASPSAAVLAGGPLRCKGRHPPKSRPQAAEGIPKGLAPLALPAQGRVQGSALPGVQRAAPSEPLTKLCARAPP